MNQSDEAVFEVTEEYTLLHDGQTRRDLLSRHYNKDQALTSALSTASRLRNSPDAAKMQRVLFVHLVDTVWSSDSALVPMSQLIEALSID